MGRGAGDVHDAARVSPLRSSHAVRFYENEKSLAQIVADFLADGLTEADPRVGTKKEMDHG
jgi:hypothetical protein